eukprot:6490996-Amphidinium_carterae.1
MPGPFHKVLSSFSESQLVALKDVELAALKQQFMGELSEEERSRKESGQQMLCKFSEANRSANRSWVRALDSLLRNGTGRSLMSFLPARVPRPLTPHEKRYMAEVQHVPDETPVRRSCIYNSETGAKEVEVPRRIEGGKLIEPTLHISADQGSLGVSSLLWLTHKQKLRVTLAWDCLHRWSNDWQRCLQRTGLTLVKMDYRVLVKLKQTPFQTQANHSMLKDISRNFFSVHDTQNVLWELLYERIADSIPELAERSDYGSNEHMHDTWEWAKQHMEHATLDDPEKQGRWFSFEHVSQRWHATRWVVLMLLLYHGCSKKWWRSLPDSPFMNGHSEYSNATDEQVEDAVADAGGAAIAEGAIDDDQDELNLQSTSVGAARRMAAQKRRTQSILKHSATLLSDEVGCRLWMGIANLCRPLKTFHAKANKQLRAFDTLRDLLLSFANGSSMDELVRDQLRWCLSAEFAAHCGVRAGNDYKCTEYIKSVDRMVLKQLWMANLYLLEELLLTKFLLMQPPYRFLELLSNDASEQRRVLKIMQREWDSLQKYEAENLWGQNSDAAALHLSLFPAQQTYVREIYVKCMETDWEVVTPEVQRSVEMFARSHHSTLLVENVFNDARRISSKCSSGRLCPAAMWHISSKGKTPEQFDRVSVEVDARQKAVGVSRLPHGVFDGSLGSSSISDDMLLDLTSRKPTWATISPLAMKASAASWFLLQAQGGDYRSMESSWLSLLLEVGQLVMHRDHKAGTIVIGVTPHGFWTVRARATKSVVTIDYTDEEFWKFNTSMEPAAWKVIPTTVEPNSRDTTSSVSPGDGLVMRPSKEGEWLLRHSARRGFPNLNLYYLRKLRAWRGLPAKSKETVPSLVHVLMEQILGTAFDEDALALALKTRGCAGNETVLASTKLFQASKDDVFQTQEEWDEEDDMEVYANWEQLKQRKCEIKMHADEFSKYCDDWVQAAQTSRTAVASASSSSTGPGGAKRRVFNPLQTAGLSQDAASKWLPPHSSIAKDVLENRWRIKSSYLPGKGNKSKSFGHRSQVTDSQALQVLLVAAWHAYERSTGEKCPYTFENFPS